MTVQQVFTDTGRVLSCAQRLFDALNHAAQVMQRLEDFRILVRQTHLSILETLDDEQDFKY